MPKILLTVPEVSLSITRPVVLDILRQLMKDTGISDKTTVFYPGDHERGAQPNSLITATDESNMFPFNDRVTVEVEENYNTDRILSEAVHRPEHLFVFRDDRVETTIKPVYSASDIVINIKYRAPDKTSATRWRDDMRARIGMMKDERYHKVSYHYLIPLEFLVILKEIHRMREAVAGYGESFDTWLRASLTQRASIMTNLAGLQGQWGISETQQRITGYFDFDGTPELGSREDDGETWTISVSYKFTFEKPIACAMAYPLVVHNQLMGPKFRPTGDDPDPSHQVRSYSLTMDALSSFEKGTSSKTQVEGLSVPAFDEFIPSSVPGRTKRIMTMLTVIDPTRPNLLLTPEEMGSLGFHPSLLAFMKKEAAFMTKRYQSILQLDFYRNTGMLPQELVKIDSQLEVTTSETLSLRDYHHVRLSMVEDLRLLPKSALDRLRQSGEALQLLLDYLAPWLKPMGILPPILGGDYIRLQDLERAINNINSGIISQGTKPFGDDVLTANVTALTGKSYQFNTVGTLFVVAGHRSQ